MRKLAHIEKIIGIKPIEGADRIELAYVLGWQCIVKKGEFKVGDKVIYVEVDSIMPNKPEYSFLEKYKYRIKTQKLRGVYSQGLVLSLPEEFRGFSLGTDVTKKLGITKYIPYQKEIKIKSPKNKVLKYFMKYSWFRKFYIKTSKGFIPNTPKTDEERLQNMPLVLVDFYKRKCQITEKLDGQSFTAKFVKEGLFKRKFYIASRNKIITNKESKFYKTAEKYKLKKILKKYPNYTIQGEQCGIGIQGNKYKLEETKLFVFNIITDKGKFFNDFEIESFCKKNNLEKVPTIKRFFSISDIGLTVDSWVKYSDNLSKLANIPREGIVVRVIEQGKKLLSFKVLNPKFLLKYD